MVGELGTGAPPLLRLPAEQDVQFAKDLIRHIGFGEQYAQVNNQCRPTAWRG